MTKKVYPVDESRTCCAVIDEEHFQFQIESASGDVFCISLEGDNFILTATNGTNISVPALSPIVDTFRNMFESFELLEP